MNDEAKAEKISEALYEQFRAGKRLSLPGMNVRVGRGENGEFYPRHENDVCVEFWDNDNGTVTVYVTLWDDVDMDDVDDMFPSAVLTTLPNSKDIWGYYEFLKEK